MLLLQVVKNAARPGPNHVAVSGLTMLQCRVFTGVPDWRSRITVALLLQWSRPSPLVVLVVVEPGHGAPRRLLCRVFGGVPT
jgi:hypothetical protein